MPDSIEKTIYKLEIDDSAYTAGVDRMDASTKKLAASQEAANKALQTNQAALKANGELLSRAKSDLDTYTGTNDRYRKQLEKSVTDAQKDQEKLTGLVAENQKQYEEATAAAQKFAEIAKRAEELQNQTPGGRIPTGAPVGVPSPVSNFTGLQDAIPQTRQEFEQLSVAIATAEQHLNTLDKESEEFKLLKPIVDQGKIALQQYSDVTETAGGKTQSLRSQLRQAKEELVKLEQSGQGASKAYFELEKRTAKLTDEFADQQQRIRILSSDTKLLDFGKGAITAATSAFQVYTAVSILAGDESAELQKKTMQLFAAMQLLQSLEQLSNLTRREGVLATLAQSGAQTIYTTVIGASTGALKAFRIALASTGILAVVAAVGFLVTKFREYQDSISDTIAEQKLLKEATEEAIKDYTKEVVNLDIIKGKLNDLSISQAKRIELAKQYNKTADEGNKIDIKQIDNIALVNTAIDSQIAKIKERAFARAAENVIVQKTEELLLAQEKVRAKALSDEVADIEAGRVVITKGGENLANRQTIAAIENKVKNDPTVIEAKKEVDRVIKTLGGFINIDDLIKPGTDKTGGKKAVENVFIKTLRGLLARLREAGKAELQSVDLIQQEFTDKLFDEIDKIDELVAKKQLTPAQGNILTKILEKVIGKEADKSIADFKKRVQTAINKLQDEINDAQNKIRIDDLNLLQDQFDRRAAIIEFNEEKEITDVKQNTDKRLEALDLDRLLIGEENYQKDKNIIVEQGEQQTVNITRKYAVQRQELSSDIFKQSLDAFREFANSSQTGIDEETSAIIRKQSDKFLQGKITFEQFQKSITKIQKDAESERRNNELRNDRTELDVINRRIARVTDKTSEEYKNLIKQRDDQRAKIATKEKDDAIKDAQDTETDPNKKKVDTLSDYASAVGNIADAVVSFWQKANEAESKALDRSIQLQEQRVDAARRIAARGNAEYLKQEEDRLTQLSVQRENAARKQLGIDAALQASQILVGITGAISKIADAPFGAETIAEIAIIIGALASGYGIVKSLQGNQPKLAKGDKYVSRGKNPAGVDTIPALLNEGEAVIPAHINKEYHPAVSAIFDKKVPAAAINNFVKTYNNVKEVPLPNYERIKDAAHVHISSDGRMAMLLSENNKKLDEHMDLQRTILRAMQKRNVEVNFDRDGIAVMVTEFLDQKRIDSKV